MENFSGCSASTLRIKVLVSCCGGFASSCSQTVDVEAHGARQYKPWRALMPLVPPILNQRSGFRFRPRHKEHTGILEARDFGPAALAATRFSSVRRWL